MPYNIINPDTAYKIQMIAVILCTLVLFTKIFFSKIKTTNYKFALIKKVLNSLIVIFVLFMSINYFYISRASEHYIHRWDMYHTVIGSKYFNELGYTKLYECTLFYNEKTLHFFTPPARARNLLTLNYETTKKLLKKSNCNSIFSQERQKEFINDLKTFNDITYPEFWKEIFLDKGYNGSPFYTFLISNITNVVPISYNSLLALSCIDIVLVLIAFTFVLWAFGYKMALLSFIFFTLNFPNRYVHMGASILRFDYIAYTIIALCLYRKNKFKTSAFLLALASVIRMFPVLFALGFIIKALMEFSKTKKIKIKYLNFILSFIISLALLLGASLTFGPGVKAWQKFFTNMKIHNQQSAGFRIGFKNLFMFKGEITKKDRFVSYQKKANAFAKVKVYFYICFAIFLILAFMIMNKLEDLDASILFGVFTFYLYFCSTRYYYSILVLLILFLYKYRNELFSQVSTLLLFLISAIAFVANYYNNFDPFIYNYLLSFMLLVYFLYLIIFLILKFKVWRFLNPKINY
ncbi:MAG: hypothetical protein ABIA04_13505 [Pseudomonadota bacterium]